ncbi:hypothetical protein HDU86_003049 [Geranomyces michiganensis]|nr:hypothetical protein HDU86_003049 [Geranomyces michiganensis]
MYRPEHGKKQDRVHASTVKNTFNDPGWYFATKTSRSIDIGRIVDKVDVLRQFPSSPDDPVIFCTHREGVE